MASNRLRPRTLAIGFGVYFLVMAVIAWYAGSTLGYHYTVDITRWTFTIYLLVGAVFLVGIGLGAVWSARSLDSRIEALSGAEVADDVVEEVVVEETVSDDVPPPLEETPAASGDHVDRDIDELLVSLQEMEHEAEAADESEPQEAAPRTEPSTGTVAAKPAMSRADARRLEALQKKRDGVGLYFAGPALAAIGAIGVSAAMLPGSDAFLQSYFALNTSLLLGLGYSFVGIAAYVAASLLLIVRNK